MRIVLFSERLRAPYDEGIKNLAVHLSAALGAEHEVLVLTSGGHDDAEYGVQNIDANRALLSTRLRSAIQRFQPQAIIYVPTACATLFSLARARVLRHYGGNAHTALIALQPRPYTPVGRFFIRRLVSPHRGHPQKGGTEYLVAPEWVLTQSTRTSNVLRSLGCRTALLPPAVDTARFRPASAVEKQELRARYGLPTSARVVTQIGHLHSKRNLDQFLALQALRGYHTLVVASTSTSHGAQIKQALCAAGTTVIDTYVPNIEDIYRLSDLYMFLAESHTAAIEVPLSVLEAMACNLPVVCTPFGGLQDFFPSGHPPQGGMDAQRRGLFYWDGQATESLGDLVAKALSTASATRTLVEPYTWTAAAQTLVRLLQDGHSVNAPPRGGTEYLRETAEGVP